MAMRLSQNYKNPPVSFSNSAGSVPGSGLTTVTSRTKSGCSQSSGSSISQDLSDMLVMPNPKERASSRKGVNHDAVCITDTEFVEHKVKGTRETEEAGRGKAEEDREGAEGDHEGTECILHSVLIMVCNLFTTRCGTNFFCQVFCPETVVCSCIIPCSALYLLKAWL